MGWTIKLIIILIMAWIFSSNVDVFRFVVLFVLFFVCLGLNEIADAVDRKNNDNPPIPEI